MANHEIVLSLALRLYDAVGNNDIKAVKELVHRRGANCDIILPAYGISALHLAVGINSKSFSEEVTKLFLSYGGNPNVKSQEGLTPVHVASIWGRSENLKLLLDAGGDPHAVDEDGCSPLCYAEKEGHSSCIDLLTHCTSSNGYKRTPTLKLDNINGNGIEGKILENLNDILQKNDLHTKIHSNRLSVDHLLLNILGSVNSMRKCNDKRESKSWIASNSCFSSVEKLTSQGMNSEAKVESRTTEEFVRNEQMIDNDMREKNKTFSVSCSHQVCHSNMTYDISDERVSSPETCYSNDITSTRVSEPESLVSYGNFLRSVISSSRSTPIQHRSRNFLENHSKEILFESESYDGSKLTDDDSVAVIGLNHVTQRRKQPVQNGWTVSILSTSCPDLHEMSVGKGAKNITHRKKMMDMHHMEKSILQSSCSGSEEYLTVPEEIYEYTDEDEGVVLLEKRLQAPVLPRMLVQKVNREEFCSHGVVSRASSESSLLSCCTEELKNELCRVVTGGCECPVGPITSTTKRAYLRVVRKFKKANKLAANEPLRSPMPVAPKFSRELEEALTNPSKLNHGRYFELEQKMMLQFDGSGKFSQWREGNQKSSFNYLLLDPRVTHNLPLRWACDNSPTKNVYSSVNSQYWREFLSAVFYVGKGKRSRPYSHLYEAAKIWRNNDHGENKLPKKLKHILEIWKAGMGVICVHVFQNVIPSEALTREAAMIDAIGLINLKNDQRGRYYGVVSSLGFSAKRYFGSFLLYRALVIFLNEGERQIRPADID